MISGSRVADSTRAALAAWGQYWRQPYSPGLGYPSSTPESRAGQGRPPARGPYQQTIVRDSPPDAVARVEAAMVGLRGYQTRLISLRWREGVRPENMRPRTRQALMGAEAIIEAGLSSRQKQGKTR